MPTTKHRRRIKLIKPKLQLSLVGKFFGLAVLGLLLQVLLIDRLLPPAMEETQAAGGTAAAALPGVLIQVLVTSTVILFPILFSFGVLFTFRIAGPVGRFEQYLEAVVRGEETRPCKIRKGDEFVELCELLNRATAPLLRKVDEDADESGEERDEEPDETERLAG